jgi:hypothetical protein
MTLKTHSSGSGIGGGGAAGGPRFLNLSAILAAAFFLSSNILAKSSPLGAAAGTSLAEVGTVGIECGGGRTPKPGIPEFCMGTDGPARCGPDGGKGGILDGGGTAVCDGVNGGIFVDG